jgi:serine/threonine-protein kinase HipA
MRQAEILFREEAAGVLTQFDDGSFAFRYHDHWLTDSTKPPISLTLPKTQQEFRSAYLFPFFYNMLPEGSNKQIACKLNKIDLEDAFGLLMKTAEDDNIGAIQVSPIKR